MYLSEVLQRASDLAVISNILDDLRNRAELRPEGRDFLKDHLWPWWAWVLRKADEKEFSQRGKRGRILDILQKEGVEAHKGHLDILCSHVWLNTELPEDQRGYLRKIMTDLRIRLLMEARDW